MLLTSLDRESADTDTVLRLYRLRWQIEIAFKRLKGLAGLADLQAKDPRLVRSCLFAKLIVALLAEEATQNLLESFPSG
jgi:IS4 transposase